jgi:glycosyltransferase involved in cell wall biosynthesis
MSIWAHTLVKNEEKYVWFSVVSVIDHVEKVLIYDTGSTDGTVEIVKEIKKLYPGKVVFKQVGDVDIDEFTKVRQQMLDQTNSDWFLIVDGDEVWWERMIAHLVDVINTRGNSLDTIITPYVNMVGDIFHHQDKSAGMYRFDNRKGFYNLRATNRKIPGLNVKKPHGQQGYYDGGGNLIQDRQKKRRLYLKDLCYLHFTNIQRSESRSKDLEVPKREIKLKHEIGKSFPRDFYYPEVFFSPRPSIVPSPWNHASLRLNLTSSLLAPMRLLKRKSRLYEKVGY